MSSNKVSYTPNTSSGNRTIRVPSYSEAPGETELTLLRSIGLIAYGARATTFRNESRHCSDSDSNQKFARIVVAPQSKQFETN